MPTVIHDGILINPQSIETGFQPNHGVELTTESILQSMKELDDRPEMAEKNFSALSHIFGLGEQLPLPFPFPPQLNDFF